MPCFTAQTVLLGIPLGKFQHVHLSAFQTVRPYGILGIAEDFLDDVHTHLS